MNVEIGGQGMIVRDFTCFNVICLVPVVNDLIIYYPLNICLHALGIRACVCDYTCSANHSYIRIILQSVKN